MDSPVAAPIETFPALEAIPGLVHGFLMRVPGIDVATTDKALVLRSLRESHRLSRHALGAGQWDLVEAEQVHGREVLVVDEENLSQLARGRVPGVDGFVTNLPEVLLGIYVADCGAVYLVDPVHRAAGLVHSGKKGTEGGIVTNAITAMRERFGSDPADLVVVLGPCIRPPAYEVDFAGEILAQCRQAGVEEGSIHDCGTCTSLDLERYYSYRTEKGRTGRLLALLGWESASS